MRKIVILGLLGMVLTLFVLVGTNVFNFGKFLFRSRLLLQSFIDPEIRKVVLLDNKIRIGETDHYGKKFDTYSIYGSIAHKVDSSFDNVLITARMTNGQFVTFPVKYVNVFFGNGSIIPDYVSSRDSDWMPKLFRVGVIVNLLWMKDVRDDFPMLDDQNHFSNWITKNPPYSVLILSNYAVRR